MKVYNLLTRFRRNDGVVFFIIEYCGLRYYTPWQPLKNHYKDIPEVVRKSNVTNYFIYPNKKGMFIVSMKAE